MNARPETTLDLFPPTFHHEAGILSVCMTRAQINALRLAEIPTDNSPDAEWGRKVAKQLSDARTKYIKEFGACEIRCYPRLYDGALV